MGRRPNSAPAAPVKIKPKDRDTIISALRAGVVPRIGLQHIQVGRHREIQSMLRDLERVADGGASIRFVIGDYGAGKTFFLFLMRQIALQKKLVVCQADFGPDRRLHSSDGRGRALYAELAMSMATQTIPNGGALRAILESFIQGVADAAEQEGRRVDAAINEKLGNLKGMVGGHDFARVIASYAKAYDEGNDLRQEAALRWMQGEYSTKTEAKDLGVKTIIDDNNVYDGLRLLAQFVRLAGFGGMLVCLDEAVTLSKLQSVSRKSNFDQILRMINDVQGGTTGGLGILFGGTPDFLSHPKRGLHSEPPLRTRLAGNQFAKKGLVDFSGPVLSLANLTREELLVLLERLRDVFAGGDPNKYLVPDAALAAFMQHCEKRLGEAYFRTPRNTVKAFVDLLAILDQNPGETWQDLLGAVDLEEDRTEAAGAGFDDEPDGRDDGLATLRL